MIQLILVKHSLPEVKPSIPAIDWHLSQEGRDRCQALASRLSANSPGAIYTSPESKAEQTAWIVAKLLQIPVEVIQGLEEHHRGGTEFGLSQ